MISELEGWIRSRGADSVESWIRGVVERQLERINLVDPPVSLPRLFKNQQVVGIQYVDSLTAEARLNVVEDGFLIMLRRRQHRFRARFSIAHELGHIQFYDLEQVPPKRITPWSIPNNAEEQACDIYAAELLMPKRLLTRSLPESSERLSPEEILQCFPELQKKFQVSNEVIARRVVSDLRLITAIILGCKKLPKFGFQSYRKNMLQPGEAWRVCWAVVPAFLKQRLFIPRRMRGEEVYPKVGIDLDLYCAGVQRVRVYQENFQVTNFRVGNLARCLRNLGFGDSVTVHILNTKEQSQRRLSVAADDEVKDQEAILLIPLSDHAAAP